MTGGPGLEEQVVVHEPEVAEPLLGAAADCMVQGTRPVAVPVEPRPGVRVRFRRAVVQDEQVRPFGIGLSELVVEPRRECDFPVVEDDDGETSLHRKPALDFRGNVCNNLKNLLLNHGILSSRHDNGYIGRAMEFSWKELPRSLESKLLPGSVGKMHLTGMASAALQTPAHASLGADMLLAAWETDPLDGMLAGQLAQFLPADGGGLRGLFDGLAGLWAPDEYLLRLQRQGRWEKLFAVLEDKLGTGTPSLFHLQRAVELGPAERDVAWAAGFLERSRPHSVAPAVDYALSMLRLAGGDVERARDGFQALGEILPLPSIPARLGECEYRLGNRERALDLWRRALAARPWDVSLLLRTHDVAVGLDREVRPLDGPVDIFLYTFNKCGELERALKALARAGLETARVTVLDNGCTDDTAGVLTRWQADLGDRMEVISLPVNVGAPAARNWLMHRPGVDPHPWTVFLDDDAVVPADWLGRLGSAVAAYPDAGVWGCKVLDGERPHVIQNADLHPRPDYGGEDAFKPGEMSDLHHQVPDAGRVRLPAALRVRDRLLPSVPDRDPARVGRLRPGFFSVPVRRPGPRPAHGPGREDGGVPGPPSGAAHEAQRQAYPTGRGRLRQRAGQPRQTQGQVCGRGLGAGPRRGEESRAPGHHPKERGARRGLGRVGRGRRHKLFFGPEGARAECSARAFMSAGFRPGGGRASARGPGGHAHVQLHGPGLVFFVGIIRGRG